MFAAITRIRYFPENQNNWSPNHSFSFHDQFFPHHLHFRLAIWPTPSINSAGVSTSSPVTWHHFGFIVSFSFYLFLSEKNYPRPSLQTISNFLLGCPPIPGRSSLPTPLRFLHIVLFCLSGRRVSTLLSLPCHFLHDLHDHRPSSIFYSTWHPVLDLSRLWRPLL